MIDKAKATIYIRKYNAAARWVNGAVPELVNRLSEPHGQALETDLYMIIGLHQPQITGALAHLQRDDEGELMLVVKVEGIPPIITHISGDPARQYEFNRLDMCTARGLRTLDGQIERKEARVKKHRQKITALNKELTHMRATKQVLVDRGAFQLDRTGPGFGGDVPEEKEQISVDTLQTPDYTSPNKAINETKERPLKRKRD